MLAESRGVDLPGPHTSHQKVKQGFKGPEAHLLVIDNFTYYQAAVRPVYGNSSEDFVGKP
jgi:hypothetical protein